MVEYEQLGRVALLTIKRPEARNPGDGDGARGNEEAGELQTKRGGFAGIAQRERTKPIIAAVDGPALAGGCEIALACDLIVASTAAAFGIPEVKRSLAAVAGGLFRLPRALGMNVAME